jgi:NAD dependent epimerase/dehydratase family enzyme
MSSLLMRWGTPCIARRFYVPATVIRLIMGEASVLALGGQRALPKRLEAADLRSAGMT